MSPPLEIRVLGEIEVVHGGKAIPLPASKKTRALLGYLIVAGARPQPRQRLCELFWDGPDDPRAALRWSLSKLRPLVDETKAPRIVADREHVAFDPNGAIVDLFLMREDATSIDVAPIDALRAAAARFRGELLEGLDLPECYRYHEWCIAEREAARKVRSAVLATLAQRLAAQPEEALGFARARVTIDPLAEAGHVAVMQLLATLGRPREALRQYERCRRILEAQLGRVPSKELEAARSALGQISASMTPPEAPARDVAPAAARRRLVGRAAESAAVAAAVAQACAGASSRVLLFMGEPGIGKTRLLEEVADQVAARGGSALTGRAFEAEMVRPYGAWIEALRSTALGSIDPTLRAELGALLPELGTPPSGIDRNRLFDAVTRLLAHRADRAPLAVALDDLQWFDESSLALLNYASRRADGSRVLFACAARTTEIDGNPRALAFVHAAQRAGRLARVDLRPLDGDATADLVRSVDGRADAARVFAEGGGNPLFSIELARALMDGGGDTLHTLGGVIAERLSRLGDRAADLLPWVAALGNSFSVDTVAALASLPSGDLLAALDDLERHGVLRARSDNGATGYDFAHDLVRQAAYRALSEPRRRWVHLQIARALQAAGDPAGALAGDVAHHAALGGDNELAARAYVAAGERCLRLFAHADASKLAASGLQHVDHLPIDVAIGIRLALLGVQVLSNQLLRRSHELEAELSRVADAARDRGMHAEVARAFYLMSFVHNERGDAARAGASNSSPTPDVASRSSSETSRTPRSSFASRRHSGRA
jgi:DNA-binding SARP family transcriptional activator